MKMVRRKPNHARGSVLAVTLLTSAILVILIGSYLRLIRTQHLSVGRAQAWNSAIGLAEAGVEEAMAHLNSGISTNNLGVNSWQSLGNGKWGKQGYLGSGYYSVTIQTQPAVTNTCPVVTATGYVSGPISTTALARTVQVKTKPKPLNYIPGALVVMTTAQFNGQGISTDSFDSSNTNYSTGGLYDPKKALDHGDVVSLSPTPNTIAVDNGQVKGSVHVTLGGTATVGSNGSVGDHDWVNNSTSGIQEGHLLEDVNYDPPPPVVLPQFSWTAPKEGKYKIKGQTYEYSLDNSATWKLSALKGNGVYISAKNVVLYVSDDISQSGTSVIYIAPDASLTLYVGAARASFGGQGIVNSSGRAESFTYYGLPTNTKLDFGANASFVGNIYAPQAAFSLGGGGANTYDFIGSALVNSATMNGHYHFHFDEGLNVVPAKTGYVAISWDEL